MTINAVTGATESDQESANNRRFALRVERQQDRAHWALLNNLLQKQRIREIDRSFARFVGEQIEGLSDTETTLLVMTAALLSEQLGQQHVCLEIAAIRQPFAPDFVFPASAQIVALFEQPVVQQSGLFVLTQQRLYMTRYWHYEQQIAQKLLGLAAPEFSPEAITQRLSDLYPEKVDSAEPDWQMAAVAAACLNSVTAIAGGPGTGKTTTVVRILWCLSQLSRSIGQQSPVIKMVAPTGKAAARLSESVAGAINKLPSADTNIPLECSTIHRLLGARSGSVFFRHDAKHPLNLDVLVVDEASMIDMPLLAKLLAAVPAHCRVILLGDSHQLASVEVGSVFSDICSLKQGNNLFSADFLQQLSQLTQQKVLQDKGFLVAGSQLSGFTDNIIYLQKSWRFDANSGVGKLARAINQGDSQQTLALLSSGLEDIQWQSNARINDFIRAILPHFEQFHDAIEAGNVPQAFTVLSRWQVLAVQRSGKWGTLNLNQQIYQALTNAGKIQTQEEFYAGRPIMITSNDYQNRLFNGDIGIVMSESTTGLLQVWFADGQGGYRCLLPAQLPAHETLYVMTTHKSQGSEFDNVLMCLPETIAGARGKVNRELLYTGVTRARQRFMLFADELAVHNAIVQQCLRSSGLSDALATQ